MDPDTMALIVSDCDAMRPRASNGPDHLGWCALQMDSLAEEEVSHVIIDTASGPAQVRLVAPKGLFRLVIRSKSAAAKDFYEWAETLVKASRIERCVVRDSNLGHQLLLPPAKWCPIFASRTT